MKPDLSDIARSAASRTLSAYQMGKFPSLRGGQALDELLKGAAEQVVAIVSREFDISQKDVRAHFGWDLNRSRKNYANGRKRPVVHDISSRVSNDVWLYDPTEVK